jgi:hypothetical protein
MSQSVYVLKRLSGFVPLLLLIVGTKKVYSRENLEYIKYYTSNIVRNKAMYKFKSIRVAYNTLNTMSISFT